MNRRSAAILSLSMCLLSGAAILPAPAAAAYPPDCLPSSCTSAWVCPLLLAIDARLGTILADIWQDCDGFRPAF